MKTFSDFRAFALLGVIFLLAIGTVDAQVPFLEVIGSAGFGPDAIVGTELTVIFKAGYDEVGKSGISLRISASSNIRITFPTPVPGTHNTGPGGVLTVKGKLLRANVNSGIGIKATWDVSPELTLDAGCPCLYLSSAEIVVNPPAPKSPLAIGDVFEQVIEIQDATDLASWQMDIAFNPEVLEVVDISEGDFLEQDGEDALFLNEQSPGKIAVRQLRVAEIGTPMSGVSGSGVLVVLSFKFVSFSEALLGIHNVRLSDSSGERLSYSITLTPVVATHASAVAADVNQDGKVDIRDLVMVANSIRAAQPKLIRK